MGKNEPVIRKYWCSLVFPIGQISNRTDLPANGHRDRLFPMPRIHSDRKLSLRKQMTFFDLAGSRNSRWNFQANAANRGHVSVTTDSRKR